MPECCWGSITLGYVGAKKSGWLQGVKKNKFQRKVYLKGKTFPNEPSRYVLCRVVINALAGVGSRAIKEFVSSFLASLPGSIYSCSTEMPLGFYGPMTSAGFFNVP